MKVRQPGLRLLGRHVGMTHSTMVDGSLQPIDRHLNMTVVHDLERRLSVSQGLLRMLDEHLGMAHVSVPNGFLAMLHGLGYMTRHGKMRDRLVGLAGRDFGVSHITVQNGLLETGDGLLGVRIGHATQSRLGVSQRLGRVLDEHGRVAHTTMVGSLLGMHRSLCEVIILCLDRPNEKTGYCCGDDTCLDRTGHV